MKEFELLSLLLLLELSMLFAAMDDTKVDPLQPYTGSLNGSEGGTVYEDANGECILVEINHILYAFYL